MAQGKMKKKTSLPPGAKAKSGHQKKQHGPKKGGKIIPPKKHSHVQSSKLKKDLTRAINSKNMGEITAKASSYEVKGFNVVKTKDANSSKKSQSS